MIITLTIAFTEEGEITPSDVGYAFRKAAKAMTDELLLKGIPEVDEEVEISEETAEKGADEGVDEVSYFRSE